MNSQTCPAVMLQEGYSCYSFIYNINGYILRWLQNIPRDTILMWKLESVIFYMDQFALECNGFQRLMFFSHMPDETLSDRDKYTPF